MRETTDAIVGAVTGTLAAPRTLLLGRFDDSGRLQCVGRTTTLAQTASSTVAGLLAPAQDGHAWTGWSFSAGWGSRETLDATLVEPELVVEVPSPKTLRSWTATRWGHLALGWPTRVRRAFSGDPLTFLGRGVAEHPGVAAVRCRP